MRKIKSKRQKPKPFLEEWESGDKVVENDVCEHDGVEEGCEGKKWKPFLKPI